MQLVHAVSRSAAVEAQLQQLQEEREAQVRWIGVGGGGVCDARGWGR